MLIQARESNCQKHLSPIRTYLAPAVSGLLLGHLAATVVVAAGVAAVLARSPLVMTVLTTTGALYLVWLGISTLTAEAELGYQPGQLSGQRRGRGRPSLRAAAKSVESVRLEPALQAAAAQRADDDGVTVSEVVRRDIREYLHTV